jgi:hypothetical protein
MRPIEKIEAHCVYRMYNFSMLNLVVLEVTTTRGEEKQIQ